MYGQALKFGWVRTHICIVSCAPYCSQLAPVHTQVRIALRLCTWIHSSSKIWAVLSRSLPLSPPRAKACFLAPGMGHWITAPPPSPVYLNNSRILVPNHLLQ